jgi:hypothetical protein
MFWIAQMLKILTSFPLSGLEGRRELKGSCRMLE